MKKQLLHAEHLKMLYPQRICDHNGEFEVGRERNGKAGKRPTE